MRGGFSVKIWSQHFFELQEATILNPAPSKDVLNVFFTKEWNKSMDLYLSCMSTFLHWTICIIGLIIFLSFCCWCKVLVLKCQVKSSKLENHTEMVPSANL